MKSRHLAFAALALVSCTSQWNDIAHEEVVAVVKTFAALDQIKCSIDGPGRTVSLVLPYDTDPSAVTVTEFSMTEGAVCTPAIKVGDKIDLSSPLTLTLHTYDDYLWTVTATVKPRPVSEIYNMTFDFWSEDSWGMECPYAKDADSDDKSVWGYGSMLLIAMVTEGRYAVSKETEITADGGEGKAALKLESLYSEAVPLFANGTIFTGETKDFDQEKFSVSLGVPFKKRPATMDGYARYIPKNIDHAKEPYTDKAGTLDNAFVFVALASWENKYEADPPARILENTAEIPGIVGFGKVSFDRVMDAYEKFSVKIDYISEETPSFAVILASSSALGDYGTGAAGSVLYLDELGFTYE